MKKQKGIEEQLAYDPSDNKTDQHLYEMLFEQLETDKEISIKPEFSAQVMTKLKARHRKENFRENLLFGFSIAAVLVFTFLTIKVVQSMSEDSSFISFKMIMPALCLGALIVTFQLLDHSFIRRKRIQRHMKG